MKIERETLFKIAHLARLEIQEEEVDEYISDLSKVLSWMEKLNELDTSHSDPVFSMSNEQNRLRDDSPANTLERKEALNNAPHKTSEFITVPKVIE